MGIYCVADLLKNKGEVLSLTLAGGKDGTARVINRADINRLGLVLSGHLTHFPAEQVQLWGKAEQTYLNILSIEARQKNLKDLFSSFSVPPCIIFTEDITPAEEILKLADEYKLPVLKTPAKTSDFIRDLYLCLEEQLAPSIQVHGVLVEVYGLGLLITGESGIGKSECAMELIKRGHMLVADDIIKIKRRSKTTLVGSVEKLISHHIEVRGLGIIDVQAIFGLGAILDSTKIELAIKLEEWDSVADYDRLGIEEKTTSILGVNIPELTMPVKPGRNLAVLIEIAALNQRLKQKGHYSVKLLDEKLIEAMKSKKSKNKE